MKKFGMAYEMSKTFAKDDDSARRFAWNYKEKKTVPVIESVYNRFKNGEFSKEELEKIIRMK